MVHIPRTLFQSIKSKILASDKIVVIYGPRQVGKTTLVQRILQNVPLKKLAINADQQQYVDMLSSRDLERMKLLVEGYELLFIDEAQRIPDIGINLKLLHDSLPQLRKKVTKMDKIYFYDLGIRNTIINQLNPMEQRNDGGALWENMLIVERKKLLSYQAVYAGTYFWRTYTGAELDYVEERDGQLHGYEFKYGSRKPKAPQSWLDTYANASYGHVNQDNFHSFAVADIEE